MPIKASYCDAWYEACKGANNKLCIGSASEEGKPVYTYFGQPPCAKAEGSLGCKQIDEVYTSGKHICETMWGGSFKYEDDTSKDAYVMSFTEGTANPNNDMFTTMDYPPRCTGDTGDVNLTAAAEDGCPHNWHTSRQSYTVGEHQNVTDLVTAGAARRFGAAAVALAVHGEVRGGAVHVVVHARTHGGVVARAARAAAVGPARRAARAAELEQKPRRRDVLR